MHQTTDSSLIAPIWRSVAALMLSLALAACSGGGGGGSGDAQQPPPGTGTNPPGGGNQSAKIIDNEDLSAGLRGVDANANGIRDDIDRLIAQKYARTPAIQRAAEQEARALQRNMEATTREEALRAGDAIKRAAWCTAEVLPMDTREQLKYWEDLSKDIVALTANTQERFTAYWAAERLKSGAVFRQPDGRVCD